MKKAELKKKMRRRRRNGGGMVVVDARRWRVLGKRRRENGRAIGD